MTMTLAEAGASHAWILDTRFRVTITDRQDPVFFRQALKTAKVSGAFVMDALYHAHRAPKAPATVQEVEKLEKTDAFMTYKADTDPDNVDEVKPSRTRRFFHWLFPRRVEL